MTNTQVNLRKHWAQGENFAYVLVENTENGSERILCTYEVFFDENSGKYELSVCSKRESQKIPCMNRAQTISKIEMLSKSLRDDCDLDQNILEELRK